MGARGNERLMRVFYRVLAVHMQCYTKKERVSTRTRTKEKEDAKVVPPMDSRVVVVDYCTYDKKDINH